MRERTKIACVIKRWDFSCFHLGAKLFLTFRVSKIARLKASLHALDLTPFKAFGRARIPESATEASNGPKNDKHFSASQALVPHADLSSQHYSALNGTRGRFETFDKRAAMETWSLPVDRAADIYNIAMTFLVIGVMMTIAATVVLIWASGIKSRHADQHLALALAQSEQAKADTAKANERAAEFLLRAQQAGLEQEKMRLESEQVRKLSAWRRVSADQHAKIVKTLHGHTIVVTLLSPGDDPEAAQFADDIARTLTEAGVTVNASRSLLAIPIRGLAMSMSSSETATLLYLAFHGAGLEIKDLPERDPVMIVVGGRPPAF
jgi:hypothetical protein